MSATDRAERLADIYAQLANREGGIVSLLGRGDIDYLITEVNRLNTALVAVRDAYELDVTDWADIAYEALREEAGK